MIRAWSAADVRAAEEPLLRAGVPLMQRASFALAVQVLADLRARRRTLRGARVAVLAGSGNNGGDALHAGAVLAGRGLHVHAVLTGQRTHAGGLDALRSAGGRVVDLAAAPDRLGAAARDVAGADVVLDGLVGIGASGALRGVAAEIVTAVDALTPAVGMKSAGMERSMRADFMPTAGVGAANSGAAAGGRPWIVAVDTPSGIGVDDGTVPGPVLAADRTVTFGAAKPGLLLPPAAHLAGEVTVVDIGLSLERPPEVHRLDPADVASRWPVPGPADHKYTRGVVGLVAGTSTFPGAAVLAASSAVRTGVGMVRYRGPATVARAVLSARPEVVTAPGRVQSWIVGPGVPPAADDADDGQSDRGRAGLAAARGELAGLSRGPVPAVVDAGGLGLVAESCPPWFVLTPHAGELRTVLRRHGEDVHRVEIEAEPMRWARRAHELTGATILLKGAVTVVVGAGVTYAQADAPAWLSTAGAGDVLSGILGTMLAGRSAEVVADPALAAEVAAGAAVVHGLAAQRANPGGPVAALDVAEAVPGTVAELLSLR
ncbi:bifunctional ADP-dependent NAD(P)H-hydrate dehydratase/NAD(P)H-hydrate epimerase [Isoptericola aurantiacus]|uniref:bifunctional ADP-dependent NAD(P)H-hydrate dehydratase/NAD(P)H-hydrate epimerase n=1 Tax=Isoptericola aurantiacus TaxID=3377839 RepID=UPI00383AD257